jgi:hypothetical protein
MKHTVVSFSPRFPCSQFRTTTSSTPQSSSVSRNVDENPWHAYEKPRVEEAERTSRVVTPMSLAHLFAPHTSANRLLDLKSLPCLYSSHIPNTHKAIKPPKRLTPPLIPSASNIGLATRIATNANKLLAKLFAAKILAAYVGYIIGI